MVSSSLVLAAALSLASAPGVEPGTRLTYSGTMAGVKDDGNPATKKFTLSVVATGGEGDAVQFAWTLDETGRGGWTWLDRFGTWTIAAGPAAADSTAGQKPEEAPAGPALLYQRADGQSIVPLVPPLFVASAKLETGATWTTGGLEHRVSREANKADRACWEIDVRSPYGHKRTLWVQKDSPLVVAVDETVFIGQGEEHKLKFELTALEVMPPPLTAKTAESLAAWTELRKSLKWQPRTRREELSAEQIATLKAQLPKIAESTATGPFAAIAAAAERDAAGQKNRAGAVAALRAAIVGQSLGDLALTDIGGKPLADADLKGKVLVLHFWSYRDTPLEEPYGQVGYLDFLLRRRGDKDVKVIGVVVEDQLGDEPIRRSAAASARKLKSFMNLSYPIALDSTGDKDSADGSLLKRVGDPRLAGGKLPLFVVIGKDGKVAEYHAGLYEVKANEGLAELDAAVQKLLK